MTVEQKMQRMTVLKKLREYKYVAALSDASHADFVWKETVREHGALLNDYSVLCDDLKSSRFLKVVDPSMMSAAVAFVESARRSVVTANESRLEAETECFQKKSLALSARLGLRAADKAWKATSKELMQERSMADFMEAVEVQVYKGQSDE